MPIRRLAGISGIAVNVFFLVILASFPTALKAAQDQRNPRLVVHLLNYLAKDYGGAVGPNGVVLSESEFAEQKEFSRDLLDVARTLPELGSDQSIINDLERLAKIIEGRGPASDVAALATSLQGRVITAAGIQTAPSAPVDLAQGRVIFDTHCVSCHGSGGLGDGPAAAAMAPRPANLADQNRMQGVAAMNVYDSVKLGIPGTAMVALPTLGDQDAWNVAHYVLTLSAAAKGNAPHAAGAIDLARSSLEGAARSYHKGDFATAKTLALRAYLDGIEPIEPRMRASDPVSALSLEEKMATVRAAIQARVPSAEFDAAIAAAQTELSHAQTLLQGHDMNPSVAFMAASSILLREGFEAVLMILALLGVSRAMHSRTAALWIHAGWMTAVGIGVAAWFGAGALLDISGASREMLEAITSLVAVAVLLGVGFWLHSRTEIGRWNQFIKVKVRRAVKEKNHLGLASISFIAAFREAIETVLFLRAIWVDSGDEAKAALGLGVGVTTAIIILASWALLRYSARIPVRRLFAVSAVIMSVLAVILTGKGLHALQEAGFLTITSPSVALRWDLFGVFPTYETLIAQVALLLTMVWLWQCGRRPSSTASASR
ncbi:MAG: hypothetical protein RL011_1802 [Pseudomonadota bacterium]|jgi:high-affinity iron transporter